MLHEQLRQMLAALQQERQAFADIDLDAITFCADRKAQLVAEINSAGWIARDDECRAMIEAAQHLNEINRQTRNLLAANVRNRLEMLKGHSETYRAPPAGLTKLAQ